MFSQPSSTDESFTFEKASLENIGKLSFKIVCIAICKMSYSEASFLKLASVAMESINISLEIKSFNKLTSSIAPGRGSSFSLLMSNSEELFS